MFDLEQAIRDWRALARPRVNLRRGTLDELEDHLREECGRLAAAGQPLEDAWKTAVARLGQPGDIEREFAKLETLAPIDLATIGLLASVGVAGIIGAGVVLFRGANFRTDVILALHVATITLGYLTGLLIAGLASYHAVRGSLSNRIGALSSLVGSTVRWGSIACGALIAAGFTLGAVWSARRYGSPWVGDPREIGGLAALLCFAIVAAMSQRRSGRSAWGAALCVLGGGIILAAWFGAAALASSFPGPLAALGFGGLALSVPLAGLALVHGRRAATA